MYLKEKRQCRLSRQVSDNKDTYFGFLSGCQFSFQIQKFGALGEEESFSNDKVVGKDSVPGTRLQQIRGVESWRYL